MMDMVQQLWTEEQGLSLLRAGSLVLLGLVLGRVLAATMGRLIRTSYREETYAALARRLTYWGVVLVTLAMAIEELGFDLSVLLGAAGIVTVALGFASQTSASNLISGVFLILEGSISVGDVIQVGTTRGEVMSVDLLSVKLRTYDNLLVRVPNETLVKSEITNLTKFPIRRIDIRMAVGYSEDLSQVTDIIQGVCDRNTLVLQHPGMLFKAVGFGESGMNLEIGAWCAQENYLSVKTALHCDIKDALLAEGVEIPYPHRVVVDPRPA